MPDQRQASLRSSAEVPGRRQHPATLVLGAARLLRSGFPVLVAGTVWLRHWWIPATVAVVVSALAVLGWWTTRYGVRDGVLWLRRGWFSRSEHLVPVDRITGLDARRGVVQRVFGVWEVTVQTPGDGDEATVTLSCVPQQSLEELRTALAVRSPAAPAGDPTLLPTARLSTGRLFVTAVTGTSLPLLAAGLGVVWSRVEDLLPLDLRREFRRWLDDPGRLWIVLPAALLLALVGSVLVVSLRQARFTVVRDGDRLRFTRGLGSQRQGTVVVDRIQAVRRVEGLLRRPFGLCSLELEVAGVSDEHGSERVLFPLLRRSEVPDLLAGLLPELPWLEPEPLARSVRRRHAVLPAAAGVAAAAVAWWAPVAPLWSWVAAVAAVVGLTAAIAQYCAAGLARTPLVVAVRWHRVLSTHTVVARARRVQITEVTSTPAQRRQELAGIRLRLSSGRSARLRHLPATTAASLQRALGRRLAR